MGIGFQSFGGMLTGGDDAPPPEETNMANSSELEEAKIKKEREIDEQEISYNEAIKE